MIMSRKDVDPATPAFLIQDASATLAVPESAHDKFTFPLVVRETRGDTTLDLRNDGAAPRLANGLDVVLPLYSGRAPAAAPTP